MTRGMKPRKLLVADVVPYNAIQQRANGISEEVVSDYREAIANGCELPPIHVFFDGSTYRLADGFHRHEAHLQEGVEQIQCYVHRGGESEAIVFACGANQGHGLRRTNADKRKAVKTLLRVMRKGTSARKIAELAGVGKTMVQSLMTVEKTTPLRDCGEDVVDYGGELSVQQLDEDDIDNGYEAEVDAVNQVVEESSLIDNHAERLAKRLDKWISDLRGQPDIITEAKPLKDAIKRFKITLRDKKI